MNTKAKPQIAQSLNIASDTIEHMLRGVKPGVADNLHNRFAVVQRPINRQSNDKDPEGHQSVVELVTVSSDNQLLHVRRDENVESGWRADKVAMPKVRADGQTIKGNIQKIAAFYQGKSIYAMVHYPGPSQDTYVVVAMVYQSGKGWSELRLKNDVANALYSTRQTDVYRTPNGYHFFYGVSTAYQYPQFFVVFETAQDGVWAAVNETVENEGATYRLLPGSSEDQYGHTMLEITSDSMRSREFILDEDRSGFYIEWSEELAESKISAGQLSAANVHAFPSRIGTQSLLLHTNDNQLHYVAGYTEDDIRHRSLTGGANQPAALESICIGRDRFDRATVFATSARDRRLWVLRQTGLAGNKDLVFAQWVCLGNQASVIGCPRAMLDGAELFLINPNNRHLVHLNQNEDTTIWHRAHIKVAMKSNIAAEKTTVHAVDVKTQDDKNLPVANAALELQSDVATDVTINGVVRQLTSETWLRVNADLAGKLSLNIPADSLTAPNISVRISATGEIFTANPDAKVAQRLKGKDPRVQLDVMNMRKAGLIPDGVQGEAANNVVNMMKEIGKASETCDQGGTRGGQAKRFTVDTSSTGTQAVLRKEVAASELQVGGDFAQKMPQAKPQQINARRAADPFAQLAGDFINWLENAWEDVKKFVVTTGEGIVRIALTIGETVKELVVNTAEGIARAFESVFQGIAEMFRKVGEAIVEVVTKIVKFVQALFGWEDILISNDMLQLAINDTLDSAENFFSVEAVAWIDARVAELKSGIDDMFDKLEEAVGGLDPREQQKEQGQDALGANMQNSMEDNRVATDTVQNQVQRNPDPMAGATTKASRKSNDPFKDFANALKASAEKMGREVDKAGKQFKPTSLDELFSQGIGVALKVTRSMIHFAIEAGSQVLQLGLRVVGKVLAVIKDILNTNINIPLISDFYEEHSNGRKLKIMDIATLLVALPMTVIYKLVFGGKNLDAPFSKGDVNDIKKADFTWGGLMTAMSVVASGGKAEAGDKQSVGASTVPPAGGIAMTLVLAVKLLRLAAPLLKPLIKAFTIVAGFFEFLYGWIASLKHGADTHDITGTSGKVAGIIGYIGKFIQFALTVPGLVVTMVSVMDMVGDFFAGKEEEESDNDVYTMPLIMSAVTGILTLVGLGLTIFSASNIVTFFVDLVGGLVLFGAAVYTVVALSQIGIATQDGVFATSEGLSELATLFGSIPGLVVWLVPIAAAMNISAAGSGEPILIILVAVEVICATVAGFSMILSIALPGLFNQA